jgi:hypothetical protein
MKTLFEEKANPLPFEIKMVFEDMFLNFPDRTKEKLSYLEIRDNQFARLKNVNSRIFVTVGHKYNTDRYYKNKNYIQKLISEGKEIRVVYKPSGGMYNILDKSGLLKEYWEKCKEEWRKAKPKQNEEEPGGHSAPGRLLVIAEKLINRGEKIFDEAKAVQDCIHGATLALEAQELLGYRTPTTSLEAIALRHKLEVKAECMFYGMEHNIDVKNRIEEIEKEVDVVAQWFNPRVKKRAALNAKMGIITEVMRIFKNYGQFDEEEECLNYFRGLNRRWSLMQPGFKGTFFWIIFPIRWYVEKLVGSLPLFILALISWPALLGIFSAWTRAKFFVNEEFKFRFWDHVMDSFSTFFGLQPGNFPTNAQGKILTIILIFLGFIHLGIFISHLYTLITRR